MPRSKTSSCTPVPCRRSSRENRRRGPSPHALRSPSRRRAPGLPPPQHGAHPRQQLSEAEWLGDIVIGAEFQPNHAIDLVASMTGGEDHRNIRARPDLAQQIEPVLLTQPYIED